MVDTETLSSARSAVCASASARRWESWLAAASYIGVSESVIDPGCGSRRPVEPSLRQARRRPRTCDKCEYVRHDSTPAGP